MLLGTVEPADWDPVARQPSGGMRREIRRTQA